MPKAKSPTSSTDSQVISFRLPQEDWAMLVKYAASEKDYDGKPLKPTKAAKKVLLEFLHRQSKRK
jgi:hypothetical protein